MKINQSSTHRGRLPSILSSISSILVSALSLSSASALKCDKSTEALLQVKYALDQSTWDKLWINNYDTPSLSIRPSGNTGTVTLASHTRYNELEDLVDYELCIPHGACMEIAVKGLPTNTFEILWDGKSVEVDHEYKFGGDDTSTSTAALSTTEVGGSCFPTCDESTEALFEYEYWTGGVSAHDYQVSSVQNGKKLFGCDASNDCRSPYYTMYKHRECLPRDACYQFDIGGSNQWIQDEYIVAPSYSVYFDGELIDTKDTWLFESVKFGDNCPNHECNPDTESTVEFFLHQYSDTEDCSPAVLDWDLTLSNLEQYGLSKGINKAKEGSITTCSKDNSILVQETMCIPKDSCASFHMESSTKASKFQHNSPRYRLTMDGVTYRNSQWWLSHEEEVEGNNDEFLSHVTHMGKCTVHSICEEANQDLFEAELQTVSSYIVDEDKSYPAIGSSEIDWVFDYYLDDHPVFKSGDFFDSAYDLGVRYHTIACAPIDDKEHKYDFTITEDSPVESYTVKRNGVVLSSRGELGFVKRPPLLSFLSWLM